MGVGSGKLGGYGQDLVGAAWEQADHYRSSSTGEGKEGVVSDLHLGSRSHSVHIWKSEMQSKCFPRESSSAVRRAEGSRSGVGRRRWPGRAIK